MLEKIYIDMDGVLADFDRGVEELCGVARPEPGKSRTQANDNLMWERMKSVEHFYNNLEPMPGAIEMFNIIRAQYGDCVEILSGIPKPKREIETAGEDKICWAHRNLCENLKVNIVYSAEKANFCKGKDYILIDDMVINIKEWEEAGGTGILHKSPELTLLQLNGL